MRFDRDSKFFSSIALIYKDRTATPKNTKTGRVPSPNLLRHQPGPREPARNVRHLSVAFNLFIIDNMLSIIVDYINANVELF